MNQSATLPAATRTPSQRLPNDRFYSILHWTCMAIIASLVGYGLAAPRFSPLARPAGFRLFVPTLICMNLVWWSVADRRFARYVPSSRLSAACRVLAGLSTMLFNVPLVQIYFTGRMPALLSIAPEWYSAAVMIWHLGLITVMPLVALVRIAWIVVVAMFRRLARGHLESLETPEPAAVDLSRRAVLKTAFGSAPMLLLAGTTTASRIQAHQLQINRHSVAAPWLPQRLRGLTITHVSDLHVGRLYRPNMLPHLVEQVNRLNSDLLVITGDIVDFSNEMLPPALEAIAHMHHRHGVFACIGNHDEFDNRAEFIRLIRQRLPLLIDQRLALNVGGERIALAGVDWSRDDQAINRRPGHQQHVAAMLDGYDSLQEGPIIALAHHPHAWDSLAAARVPLVLSGHTHGGQIMLTPPSVRPDAGIGSLLFRYVRGFYQTQDSTLFVNRGVGNWFPLRINAPAEIVQLQLV